MHDSLNFPNLITVEKRQSSLSLLRWKPTCKWKHLHESGSLQTVSTMNAQLWLISLTSEMACLHSCNETWCGDLCLPLTATHGTKPMLSRNCPVSNVKKLNILQLKKYNLKLSNDNLSSVMEPGNRKGRGGTHSGWWHLSSQGHC